MGEVDQAARLDAQMPPWGIDRTSASRVQERSVAVRRGNRTIVDWADAGAPLGNAADMPQPREFDDPTTLAHRQARSDRVDAEYKVPAGGADWWGRYFVETGLTEDRYIKAIESKPGKSRRRASSLDIVEPSTRKQHDESNGMGRVPERVRSRQERRHLPRGTGRLLKAGAKIKLQPALSLDRRGMSRSRSVGIVFYPKGQVPKHAVITKRLGAERSARHPAGRPSRAGRLRVLQPGGEDRGVPAAHAQPRQAPVPRADLSGLAARADDLRELRLQLAHRLSYDDDAAPIFPAGTMIHVISWHDNSRRTAATPTRGTGPASATARLTTWRSRISAGTTCSDDGVQGWSSTGEKARRKRRPRRRASRSELTAAGGCRAAFRAAARG